MGSMRSGPKRSIAITASTSGAVRPLPTLASLEVLAVRAAAQDHADAAQKDESWPSRDWQLPSAWDEKLPFAHTLEFVVYGPDDQPPTEARVQNRRNLGRIHAAAITG